MLDPTAMALFEQGNVLYKQKEYDLAIAKYRTALFLDPTISQAYNNWGRCLKAQSKYKEAIEKFSKAIEYGPDNSAAYNNLGILLRNQGYGTRAIENYSAAVTVNPNFYQGYYNWGCMLSSLGQYQEACEKYAKVIELRPKDSDAYNNWGSALMAMGKYEEAAEKYRKAIQYKPNDSQAHYNLGRVLHQQGKHDEAIKLYSQAVNLDPKDSMVYYNWGLLLLNMGKYSEAIARLRRAGEMNATYRAEYTSLLENTLKAMEKRQVSMDNILYMLQSTKEHSKDLTKFEESAVNLNFVSLAEKVEFIKVVAKGSNLLKSQKRAANCDNNNAPCLIQYQSCIERMMNAIFSKVFVEKEDDVLTVNEEELSRIVSLTTSDFPNLETLPYAHRVFPKLLKKVPSGITVEDQQDIRKTNKAYKQFISRITSFEEVNKVVEGISKKMVALREEYLLASQNERVQENVVEKGEKLERALDIEQKIETKAHERALLDLDALVLLCFLEGVAVKTCSDKDEKIRNVIDAVGNKMRRYCLGEAKVQPEP